tara:strand:- start:8329 stop:8619 length:291 start_codon:yes stop_codon:yes gene_type:complete
MKIKSIALLVSLSFSTLAFAEPVIIQDESVTCAVTIVHQGGDIDCWKEDAQAALPEEGKLLSAGGFFGVEVESRQVGSRLCYYFEGSKKSGISCVK